MKGNNHQESSSFSSTTVTKQNNHGSRKMAKKIGVVLIPGEQRTGERGRERGGGVGVIPKERGAKQKRGAEAQT